MCILKYIKYSIAIAFLLSISFHAFSQGCMGGDDGAGVKLRGFIQPQYNVFLNGQDEDGNSLVENEFTFNRARIGILGSIPYDIDYYVFMEMSSFKSQKQHPHLLDAYVSYTRFQKWFNISLGQFKSPFGLEQNTSCSGLYTINRSEVVSQLAGPQRDLGIMFSGGHDTLFVKYSLGIMNGVGINEVDDNNNKHIVGRLRFFPHKYVQVGGSFRMGKTNPRDEKEKLNNIMRFGGEVLFQYKNLMIQSEYIVGNDELFSISKVPIYGG